MAESAVVKQEYPKHQTACAPRDFQGRRNALEIVFVTFSNLKKLEYIIASVILC